MLSFFSMNPSPSPKLANNSNSALDRDNVKGEHGAGGRVSVGAVCKGDVHGQVFLAQIGAAYATDTLSEVQPGSPSLDITMAAASSSSSSSIIISRSDADSSLSALSSNAVSLGAVFSLPFESLPTRPYPAKEFKLARLDSKAPAAFVKDHQATRGKMGLVEKNLLFFEYAGRTLFVYRIYPHVVVEMCVKSVSVSSCPQRLVVLPAGSARVIADVVREYGAIDDGLIAHGGAAPVPYYASTNANASASASAKVNSANGNSSTASSSAPLFLATFHTLPLYRHYLYVFEARKFNILAVSAPLPLTEHPAEPGQTFISSLVPSGDGGYSVLYGSGDRESRVLVLSKEAVAKLFAHADL